MKIRYKHQRFQAEATKCVNDVFQRQTKHDTRRHFAAISTGDVVYSVVKTYRDLYNVVTK